MSEEMPREKRPIFYAAVLLTEFEQVAEEPAGKHCIIEHCAECGVKVVVVTVTFAKALILAVNRERPSELLRPFQVLCPSCFTEATAENPELIELGFANPEVRGMVSIMRYLAEQN